MHSDNPGSNHHYDRLLNVPSGWTGELIDGKLFTFPRPVLRHVRVTSQLGSRLITIADRDIDDSGPFEGDRGWYILIEPEIRLNGDALVPDIAGWLRHRITPGTTDYIECAPDWVCEVLSPSTNARDRGVKADWYFEHGVQHYWIADPDSCTIEVCARGETTWNVVAIVTGNLVVRCPPFADTTIDLRQLWVRAA